MFAKVPAYPKADSLRNAVMDGRIRSQIGTRLIALQRPAMVLQTVGLVNELPQGVSS